MRDRMLTESPWPPAAETRGSSQVTKQKTITDLDAYTLSRDVQYGEAIHKI